MCNCHVPFIESSGTWLLPVTLPCWLDVIPLPVLLLVPTPFEPLGLPPDSKVTAIRALCVTVRVCIDSIVWSEARSQPTCNSPSCTFNILITNDNHPFTSFPLSSIILQYPFLCPSSRRLTDTLWKFISISYVDRGNIFSTEFTIRLILFNRSFYLIYKPEIILYSAVLSEFLLARKFVRIRLAWWALCQHEWIDHGTWRNIQYLYSKDAWHFVELLFCFFAIVDIFLSSPEQSLPKSITDTRMGNSWITFWTLIVQRNIVLGKWDNGEHLGQRIREHLLSYS